MTAKKQKRQTPAPTGLIGTACAMTRNRHNDTSALHAYRHGAARHKNGESAGFIVIGLWLMPSQHDKLAL